jgi:hypothetical protein
LSQSDQPADNHRPAVASIIDVQGLLVEHGFFALSDRQAGLHNDITVLSEAVASTRAEHARRRFPGNRRPSPSEGTKMTVFRVGFFPDFNWGDDAVLIGADRDGLRMLQSAMRSAHENGPATFEIHGVRHRIVQQDDAADIELGSQTVVWRFDDTKLATILDMVTGLIDADHPAHNYFDDLNSPDATLIISVNEYVDGGPFSEFPQGMPLPPPSVES